MQHRWVGKKVDLDTLSKRIGEFYEHKGFKTTIESSKDGYKVIGVLRVGDKLRMSSANIRGNPNDFTVEFSDNKGGGFSILLGPFVTLLGGGVFVLDRLRSREFYEKLEGDFWISVEQAVEQLTVS
mgnify:CR=1 FL=1